MGVRHHERSRPADRHRFASALGASRASLGAWTVGSIYFYCITSDIRGPCRTLDFPRLAYSDALGSARVFERMGAIHIKHSPASHRGFTSTGL